MPDTSYIWQLPYWPNWQYESRELAPLLGSVRLAQGRLLGRMQDLGMAVQSQANLSILTEDVIKTSAIEGETLSLETVRSSVARKMGLDIGALAPTDRMVDGIVDVVLDATAKADSPLTASRLFAWHAALFPTGRSGMVAIDVGVWRSDATGAMQVVSGPLHRQKVHFEAPPAERLAKEVDAFLQWFNQSETDEPVIKAGLAHLWFVTLHPFDDGNGRIARAIGDMALSRAEGLAPRYYSLSAQFQCERNAYYDELEAAQKGSLDITRWLMWFLGCLLRALEGAELSLAAVLFKAQFWRVWAHTPMNERQIKLLNRFLDGFDGFEGKLTSRKWAAIAKCSADSALRDINDLIAQGVLCKDPSGGRSSSYVLAELSETR